MTSALVNPTNQSAQLHPALAYFVEDHAVLQPALEALQTSIETHTPPSAALLQHLYDHMAEHFGMEETVLFPAVPFVPSAVLLAAEHDDLWQLWDDMASACRQIHPDWPAGVQAYVDKMQSHIHEENACLLPSCERDMAASAKTALMRKIERAQQQSVWQRRSNLPKSVHRLIPPEIAQKMACTIQSNCKAEWYTLPTGQGLKPHVSPHAQTLIVLSGKIMVQAGNIDYLLGTGEGLDIDPVTRFSLHSLSNAWLLSIKQPVMYRVPA